MSDNPEHIGNLSRAEKNRLRDARLERLSRITEMYLKGASIGQIAKAEGLSYHTIRRDMITARKNWLKKSERNYSAIVAEQLQKLDLTEANAWNGWELSLRNEKTVTRETSTEDSKHRKTVKGRSGNPAYLETIRKIIDQRCKLLNLYDRAKELEQMEATVIEVVIENTEQAKRFMGYEDFEKISGPSEN